MANIGGEIGFGPLQSEPDVGFLDLVKRLDMGFMLHFEGRKDRWGFFFDGLYMSLSGDAKVDLGRIPLFSGFDVGGRFRQTLIKFGGFYRFPQDGWAFDLLAGAQYLDIKIDLGVGPFSDLRREKQVLDPIVGARILCDLTENWSASVKGDVGGFGIGVDLAWEVTALLGYRLSESATLRVGYRAQSMQHERGSRDLDVLLHGPIIGVSFAF